MTLARRPALVVRGPKRATEWARGETPITSLGANAEAAIDLLASYETDTGRDAGTVTVTRILGMLTVQAVSEGGTLNQLYLGITIVTRSAFAAGSSAIPMPGVEHHADWMYYGMMSPQTAFRESRDEVFRPVNEILRIDNHSQRRMNENESVLCLCVRASALNDQNTTFVAQTSVLLKLP